MKGSVREADWPAGRGHGSLWPLLVPVLVPVALEAKDGRAPLSVHRLAQVCTKAQDCVLPAGPRLAEGDLAVPQLMPAVLPWVLSHPL